MGLLEQMGFIKRDLSNIAKYGFRSPRHSQLIYVDAAKCSRLIYARKGAKHGLMRSGVVYESQYWEGLTAPVSSDPNISGIERHWRDGIPWEEIFGYRELLRHISRRPGKEGCNTIEDVVERYLRLDEIFEEARRARHLLTRRDLNINAKREVGGVLMHLGIKGEPIFGGSGYHRFCIARVLDIPLPCMVGAVHVSALPYYHRLTLPPDHPDRMSEFRHDEATVFAR